VTCNAPTLQKDLPIAFEKSGTPNVGAIVETKESDLAINAPTQAGYVWLNDNGEVIGIIFMTAQGDLFQSEDAAHSGFININQLEN
jgi:hypothetical protein